MAEPTKKQLEEIERRVAEIPSGDFWWCSDGADVFGKAARDMVIVGFTIDRAIELLSGLYGAVAGEFGG